MSAAQPTPGPAFADMTWRESAACSPETAALFDYPDEGDRRGGDVGAPRRTAKARAICARCPVAAPCLIDARRSGGSGIRAGLLLTNGRLDRRNPDSRDAA